MSTAAGLFAALRGGATFDRKRFGGEMQRWGKGGESKSSGGVSSSKAIDFFGTRGGGGDAGAEGASAGAKRKKTEGGGGGRAEKKGRASKVQHGGKGGKSRMQEVEEDDEDEEEEEEEEEGGSEGEDDEGVKLMDNTPAVRDVNTHASDKQSGKKSTDSKREQLALFRRQMRINVTGDSIPPPVGTFEDMTLPLGVSSWLRHGVEDIGWLEPTPIQMQAIPCLLAGQDVVASAPTGSGKTGAFVIPMYAMLGGPRKEGTRGLIISPTRELAVQIHQQCALLRSKCKIIVRLLTKATSSSVSESQLTQDLLISTPARLVALVSGKGVDLSTVTMVVIDEADKLFDHGFVEQIDDVLAACTHKKLQKALFSATMPPAVENLARSIMPHPVMVTIGGKVAASEKVKQSLMFVGSEEGKLLAVRQLVHKGLKPPVLMFVQSIDRAKQLFRELIFDGINVDVMHAERTQAQRDATVRNFRSGDIWVLICTDLMARGIDFKGVNLVVNYDFPQSVVSYIHRIGRTGRGGRSGEAITFFTMSDASFLRSIANVMVQSGCEVPDWMLTLKKAGKRAKKDLARKAPEREDIFAIPAGERRQRAHKAQMIQQSREKKKRG